MNTSTESKSSPTGHCEQQFVQILIDLLQGPRLFRFAQFQKNKRLQRGLPAKKEDLLEKLHAQAPLFVEDFLPHIHDDVESCLFLLALGDAYLKDCRYEAALASYTQSLKKVSQLYGKDADTLFIETSIRYSRLCTAKDSPELVISVLQEALGRARKRKEQSYCALIQMHLAKNEWLRSRYSNCLRHFENGWSLAISLDNPKLLTLATTFRISFLAWQGRFRDAIHVYENSIPDVEKYPKGGFPLLAAQVIGRCYTQVGMVTQGLGMLDRIQRNCLENGNKYVAANAAANIGATMIEIRRIDEALYYLKNALDEAKTSSNHWIFIQTRLMLSYAYFLKSDIERSLTYLREFLDEIGLVKVTVQPNAYLLELAWETEQGSLPKVPGLSFSRELDRMLASDNVYLRGIAYRYQALYQEKSGGSSFDIFRSLKQSIRLLQQSGHQACIAISRQALARQHSSCEENDKAGETALSASALGADERSDFPVYSAGLGLTESTAINRFREIAGYSEIVGKSAAIKRVIQQIELVAGTDATVMITGETGVGKELIARAIHFQSARSQGPYVCVDCSAFPATLIHSELFGHEKGAFTGATYRRIGRFEQADGGTLFLDEIGDISLEAQTYLVRVVETKEFERLGAKRSIRSNFRLVAATRRVLEEEIKAENFRDDLYYRLNIFPIYVPSLRERIEDIPILADYFMREYGERAGKVFNKISDRDKERLVAHDWPGNVRELKNIIERGVIVNPGPEFHVPNFLSSADKGVAPLRARTTLKEGERNHILLALKDAGWKVRGKGGAAEFLDIKASTLESRMKKLGIRRPQKNSPDTQL